MEELIDYLISERVRGEASIGTAEKVWGALKSNPSLQKRFNAAYVDYFNEDLEEVPEDIFNATIAFLKAAPDSPKANLT
jgi:hypothetical protein